MEDKNSRSMNEQQVVKISFVCWVKRIWKKLFGRKECPKAGPKGDVPTKKKDIHDIALDQVFGPEGGEGEVWEHKGFWRR